MSKFKFELPAPQDSASVYSKIKNFLSGENDFKKFDPKVACTFDEPNKTCNVTGSQFTANMQILPNDTTSSRIVVEVELPIALSFFKGKIQETIEKNLNKLLT